jgi:hypothetical protein
VAGNLWRLYQAGAYSGGSELATFTINSVVTQIGSSRRR